MLKLAIENQIPFEKATARESIDTADKVAVGNFFSALTTYYDFSEAAALDMFARDGILTVCQYADKVKSLDLWELNGEHEEALRRFKGANIKIGCSFKSLQEETKTYDLIVVDSPQGLYPDYAGNVQAEHFGMIPLLPRIMSDRCVVVFYVNQSPYNRDAVGMFGRDDYGDVYSFENWMKARANFYGVSDPRYVREEDAIKAYRHWFGVHGYRVKTTFLVPCYDYGASLPPSFRLALELVRG